MRETRRQHGQVGASSHNASPPAQDGQTALDLVAAADAQVRDRIAAAICNAPPVAERRAAWLEQARAPALRLPPSAQARTSHPDAPPSTHRNGRRGWQARSKQPGHETNARLEAALAATLAAARPSQGDDLRALVRSDAQPARVSRVSAHSPRGPQVRAGDALAARELLRRDDVESFVDEKDHFGSALGWAAVLGNTDCVALMLEAGADPAGCETNSSIIRSMLLRAASDVAVRKARWEKQRLIPSEEEGKALVKEHNALAVRTPASAPTAVSHAPAWRAVCQTTVQLLRGAVQGRLREAAAEGHFGVMKMLLSRADCSAFINLGDEASFAAPLPAGFPRWVSPLCRPHARGSPARCCPARCCAAPA